MKLKRLIPLFMLFCTFCTLIVPVYAADSVPVRELDPNYATEWINLVYRHVFAESETPTSASRVYGYAGVTLYESLVNGMPDYESLTEQIGHMPVFPVPEADASKASTS